MSWTKHETVKGPDQHGVALIGAIAAKRMTLRFRPGLLKRLNWAPGQRVDVLVGSGVDSSRMRVVAAEDGCFTIHGRTRASKPRWGDTLVLAIKPPHGFTRRPVPARELSIDILEPDALGFAGVEFTVPFDWREAQAKAAA